MPSDGVSPPDALVGRSHRFVCVGGRRSACGAATTRGPMPPRSARRPRATGPRAAASPAPATRAGRRGRRRDAGGSRRSRPRGRGDALGLERAPRRPRPCARPTRTRGRGQLVAASCLLALAGAPARLRPRRSSSRRPAWRPGGALIVAVPNTRQPPGAAFGDRWLHLDLPRHLVHLPAAALLDRAARALGLRVTRVSHWRGGQALFGWLHGLVGRLPGHPDLYDAIRRPEARSSPHVPAPPGRWRWRRAWRCSRWPPWRRPPRSRARRAGTVYVEARHDLTGPRAR